MTSDPLDLQSIDYVEFYVSNARQAAHFYRTALGLRPVAYAEPGSRMLVAAFVGATRLIDNVALP